MSAHAMDINPDIVDEVLRNHRNCKVTAIVTGERESIVTVFGNTLEEISVHEGTSGEGRSIIERCIIYRRENNEGRWMGRE